MQRLFVESALQPGGEISLSAEQNHYLFHVLRMKPGASLLVFNGKEGEWDVSLGAKGTLQVRAQTRPQPLEKWTISLFFAPLKAHRLEMTIEKATELGATELIPCLTDYTQVRRLNLVRLQAIAREAAEQSHRLTVPFIAPLAPLGEHLSKKEAGQVIFFADAKTEHPFFSAQMAHRQAEIWEKKSMGLVIGPEGGWSPAERGLNGPIPVNLGETVLRAETASVVGLTLLQEGLRQREGLGKGL